MATPVPPVPDDLIDPVLLALSTTAWATAALNELPETDNSHWTVHNEIALLKHFVESCSAASNGTSFTQTVFKFAADAVNADSLEKGAPKTWESWKSKI